MSVEEGTKNRRGGWGGAQKCVTVKVYRLKRKGGNRPEGTVASRFEIKHKKGEKTEEEEEEEEGKGEEGLCWSVCSPCRSYEVKAAREYIVQAQRELSTACLSRHF